MNPVDVRQGLVEALRLNLVGPGKGSALEGEILSQAPSRWYLTGFLVPFGAEEAQRVEETGEEQVDELAEAGGTDDAAPPEPSASRRALFPSSIGMSILLRLETRRLHVIARWGDYRREKEGRIGGGDVEGVEGQQSDESSAKATSSEGSSRGQTVWMRTQREIGIDLDIPGQTPQPVERDLPESNGLKVVNAY